MAKRKPNRITPRIEGALATALRRIAAANGQTLEGAARLLLAEAIAARKAAAPSA